MDPLKLERRGNLRCFTKRYPNGGGVRVEALFLDAKLLNFLGLFWPAIVEGEQTRVVVDGARSLEKHFPEEENSLLHPSVSRDLEMDTRRGL